MTLTTAPSESFDSMWGWLCDIAAHSRADSPLAIHSQSGDRQGWGNVPKRYVASRGLPFSRSFLRRVDHTLPQSLQDGLSSLKPAADLPAPLRRVRRASYRVVVAVLREGHTDVEECRGSLGMDSFAFQVAATNGILALRSALNRE